METTPIWSPEAIDGHGNLWVAAYGAFYMWTPDQLSQSCASAPTTMLQSEYTEPLSIAFDSQGSLWVAGGANDVNGYRASDLGFSENIEPDWFLTVDSPQSLAFDSDGFLWIANNSSVIAYSPASLMAAGVGAKTPSPDLVLTNGFCYHPDQRAECGFQGVAFDAQGNLWVSAFVSTSADRYTGGILEFSRTQLQSLRDDGAPSPVLSIIKGTGPASIWLALAFDSEGRLWTGATNGASPNLWGISVDGTQPDINLTVPGNPAFSLAFSPIPSRLPLQP